MGRFVCGLGAAETGSAGCDRGTSGGLAKRSEQLMLPSPAAAALPPSHARASSLHRHEAAGGMYAAHLHYAVWARRGTSPLRETDREEWPLPREKEEAVVERTQAVRDVPLTHMHHHSSAGPPWRRVRWWTSGWAPPFQPHTVLRVEQGGGGRGAGGGTARPTPPPLVACNASTRTDVHQWLRSKPLGPGGDNDMRSGAVGPRPGHVVNHRASAAERGPTSRQPQTSVAGAKDGG